MKRIESLGKEKVRKGVLSYLQYFDRNGCYLDENVDDKIVSYEQAIKLFFYNETPVYYEMGIDIIQDCSMEFIIKVAKEKGIYEEIIRNLIDVALDERYIDYCKKHILDVE